MVTITANQFSRYTFFVPAYKLGVCENDRDLAALICDEMETAENMNTGNLTFQQTPAKFKYQIMGRTKKAIGFTSLLQFHENGRETANSVKARITHCALSQLKKARKYYKTYTSSRKVVIIKFAAIRNEVIFFNH